MALLKNPKVRYPILIIGFVTVIGFFQNCSNLKYDPTQEPGQQTEENLGNVD